MNELKSREETREAVEIIKMQDGLPVINKILLSPDQKTLESLNLDFKNLVDSILGHDE